MQKSQQSDTNLVRRRPPATTSEAREKQMISIAMDLAEKQLLEGKASSQIIAHFLKLASVREQRELELLYQELELKKAKTKALEDAQDMKELYSQALIAMSRYQGSNRGDEDD